MVEFLVRRRWGPFLPSRGALACVFDQHDIRAPKAQSAHNGDVLQLNDH